MNRFERRIKAIDEQLKEHAVAYKAVLDKADEENRQPTDEDRAEITEHMKRIEVLKVEKAEAEANAKQLQEVDDLSKNLGPQFNDFGKDVKTPELRPERIKTLGEQF